MLVSRDAALVAVVVLCSACSALAAQGPPLGTAEYLDGLSALAAGRTEESLAALAGAVQADDENASYHTARGVALYVLEKADQAADEFERAMRLGPPPATALWGWANAYVISFAPVDDTLDPVARQRAYQQRRRTTFDSRPPYESTEPYARPFIEAAMLFATPQEPAARDATRRTLRQFAAEFAWNEMSGPKFAGMLMGRVKSLFEQRSYADSLALIERIRPKNPGNPDLLYYSAGCKLQLGDLQSAREEYTQVLRERPQHAESLLGRAHAAAKMGALERANHDLETAASIDPKATEALRKAIAEQLEKGAASVPEEPPAELLAALKKAVLDNGPPAALADKAERLMRAAWATRFDRNEAYSDEYQRLDAAVKANSTSADALAALGAFLVNPTIVRPVRLAGASGSTRIALGEADIPRAEQAINAALAINPQHVHALTQKALAAVARQQPDEAIKWVQQALRAGGASLDLVRIHLDYHTSQANDLAAQAYALRQPKTHTEYRADGEYLVTVYPSQADLQHADELDRQSDDLRRTAAAPLQAYIESARGTIDGHIASAEFGRWLGKYDEALASLDAALALDPWNLEAHEFYVDLCPKIGLMDKALEHQNILNNLTNPSAGRTLDRVWTLTAETKFRSARETIDEAEKIDPASPSVPAYRAAVAGAEKKADEMIASIKQAIAMEEGCQRVFGRSLADDATAPLRAADVALVMILRQMWAQALMDQRAPAEACNQLKSLILLGLRVPAEAWDAPVQVSALPAVEGAKDKGSTIRQLLSDAHYLAAVAQLDADNPDEAAKHLMSHATSGGTLNFSQSVQDLGHRIYSKIGPERAARYFDQNMLLHFQMLDDQADNRAILERGDQIQNKYQQKIADLEQRRNELAQRLMQAQQSRNSQQMHALMEQRQALDMEYHQLMQQMNQEQMQNMDPNYRRGR